MSQRSRGREKQGKKKKEEKRTAKQGCTAQAEMLVYIGGMLFFGCFVSSAARRRVVIGGPRNLRTIPSRLLRTLQKTRADRGNDTTGRYGGGTGDTASPRSSRAPFFPPRQRSLNLSLSSSSSSSPSSLLSLPLPLPFSSPPLSPSSSLSLPLHPTFPFLSCLGICIPETVRSRLTCPTTTSAIDRRFSTCPLRPPWGSQRTPSTTPSTPPS